MNNDDAFKNAWHNVKGITTKEMAGAAEDAERIYGDIIDLPHHVSSKHAPLSESQKAAQFAPFAALTGFGAEIAESGRRTQEKRELTDGQKEELDIKLAQLSEEASDGSGNCARVRITYFVRDERKSGGSYETHEGSIKRTDPLEERILMDDGFMIEADDVYDIEKI